MKTRLYNFFNHPWVAFPLCVVVLVLFLWVGFKAAAFNEAKYPVNIEGAK